MGQAVAKTIKPPKQRVVLKGISVVVPTLNEVDNVHGLVKRIASALSDRAYEIIFVDDHSSDGTIERVRELSKEYPIVAHTKTGRKGKAFSLVEGFALARYELIAMIDADLQYPPEAIPAMSRMIEHKHADVVVANRKHLNSSRLRRTLSNGFRAIFGKALWGLDVDVQSGLKVFKRELIECLTLHPTAPWTFDLEFLISARNGGYELGSHTIDFVDRTAGRTKVRWMSAAIQIGLSSINLRMSPPNLVPFHDVLRQNEGHGFHFRSQKYVTHTPLAAKDMAVQRTSPTQRMILYIAGVVLLLAFMSNWHRALVGLVVVMTVFYFCDLLFNLYLIIRSFYQESEFQVSTEDMRAVRDWPRYTIFCPLYREVAVVPQFVRAMSNMDYPHDKLEVQLLLEEDDHETIDEIRNMVLPQYFKVIIVPDGLPKTKPKACNYGLLQATGEYAVIYDAEDVPDVKQLKKSVVAFQQLGTEVGCIQAKLNYYNTEQNLLTRLFTLEYSLWFSLVLTGLNSIKAPIPLGGTSNHFRVSDLHRLEGWDPFNVTEDADLGLRLAKRGMRTAILDSFTLEEANSQLRNWMKQRSRWIKGYMQTYLVHMRSPMELTRHKKSHLPIVQLVVGGKILSLLINPILWILTTLYILLPVTNDFIRSLYPMPVLYIGTTCLVLGNFMYMYYYALGVTKQHHPELVVYAFLVPIYWVMMSIAAFYALRDLIVRPHHWHKTKHGLHLRPNDISQQNLLPETT
jgi:cellulose synthase/poly-beta-1,6-N-acetylglucosamine synthase-like glycosyltransferase